MALKRNTNAKRSRKFNLSMKNVRNVIWYPIPLALGIIYISYQRFVKRGDKIETNEVLGYQGSIFTNLEISLIKMLPLRLLSRIWGIINSVYLPLWMREPIIGSYSRLFHCNVQEALVDDLKSYSNLGQFFRRDLKPGLRPIAKGNVVVSPADGTVVHFGRVENELIEQVKGVTYSLPAFLGPQTWKKVDDAESYCQNLFSENQKKTSLFHCVIYLAPGDYHKFHSPCEWRVNFRRHFPGKLLSVRPSFASWFPRLFTINERVAYVGEWMHGFFSLIAVGATNVGSIKVYCDEDLRTNKMFNRRTAFIDRTFTENVALTKGDSFGEFNLGSTIVLVFEAPDNFTFNVKTGDRIKYGQLLSS
ncbi:phosphatidylserine decarboxylase proenzyme-like protein [Leptotrombidium deliense]|uniref:Phosphatidylserine decarboxylase proenzyme, mitochondrial n=1 Tax=Leptotrombidium deliense TaxID=299467 RepID=A0A443SGI8_9ACAR|nr:phosphatidylserine decarboxylase proenzyme-like protein [Leptotrombidium deliense]